MGWGSTARIAPLASSIGFALLALVRRQIGIAVGRGGQSASRVVATKTGAASAQRLYSEINGIRMGFVDGTPWAISMLLKVPGFLPSPLISLDLIPEDNVVTKG